MIQSGVVSACLHVLAFLPNIILTLNGFGKSEEPECLTIPSNSTPSSDHIARLPGTKPLLQWHIPQA
jgi:hypothetical protein